MTSEPSNIGGRLVSLVDDAMRTLRSQVDLTDHEQAAVTAALGTVADAAARLVAAEMKAQLVEQGHDDIDVIVIGGEPPPDRPTAAAYRWLRLILVDGDLPAAWALTDPAYRRVLVEAWVDANLRIKHPLFAGRERDELIADLVKLKPSDPLWFAFCAIQVGEIRDAMAHVDVATWGWASNPRPLDLDYELVLFIDRNSAPVVTEAGPQVPAVQMQMHYTPDEWRMSWVDVSPVLVPS